MNRDTDPTLDPALVKNMRRAFRELRVADLRDGRRTRSVTFASKKGKGSYTRKPKHAPTRSSWSS